MLRRVGHALASLRWRLTLSFVGVLALLLAGLGIYNYITLRSTLISSRTQALDADYTTARAVIARLADNSSATGGRVLCGAAPALVARSVATVVQAASGQSVTVVVYDRSLDVAATVPESASPPHVDTGVLYRVILTGVRSGPQVLDGSSDQDLAVAFPITVRGSVCGIAQMTTSMSPIAAVLRENLVVLGIGGSAALIAALVLGLLITGRVLRPLRRVTETAGRLAGGDLRARSSLEPRNDEVGQLARSFDDMAERIEAAFTAQQQSEAQVRRFIADASHELRTPVTALKGYIDVLRRGAGRDPAALDAALGSMSAEADRMRTLVLDLLTLARIDARRGMQPEDFDLDAEVGRLLDEGLVGMPPSLERHLASSPALVHGDRSAVAAIVRNLLGNANAYAPGAAQHWATTVEDGRIRLDVRDEGPGIPAADLPHVFERFYRGEKTRAREEGGSGLGLSIVQGLARSMGGDAAIQSAEGQGTTVTVWLPRAV
ncbi:MAG: HAMP domain-containing histidine kinase [Candidatus Dormibacteraeota bacterium]|nr:HAMP domain-containing histidine kinase [Candidatus Dormibacteraeota bacterium]